MISGGKGFPLIDQLEGPKLLNLTFLQMHHLQGLKQLESFLEFSRLLA